VNEDERFDIYSQNSAVDTQIEIARYLPIKGLCQGLRILDLGCGFGYSSNLLLEWGAHSVVGVDLDSDAILEASKRYQTHKVEFIQGYAEQIAELVNLKEFDGVCFVECIEHVIDPYVVLASLKNGLKDDAWIYITAPNDYWNYRFQRNSNPHHLRKFTKSDFLSTTSSVLGNPNRAGESHAFLGFSMIPNVIEKMKPEIKHNICAEIISLESYSSEDCIFYFAIWGDESIEECLIGSSASMEIYTAISDASKLVLDISDLNDLRIRDLASRLQTTTDTLVETQNQLRAIRILAESFEKSIGNGKDSSLFLAEFKNLDLRISKFKGLLSNPPGIILSIYRFLPPRTRDILRALRRRILR